MTRSHRTTTATTTLILALITASIVATDLAQTTPADAKIQASIPTNHTATDTATDTATELRSAALDTDQQNLVEFAYDRFTNAGLDLPATAIIFETDRNSCFGYGGVYVPSEHTVRICRPSETTMVHELAHAWIETNFTETDRRSFLQLRGLESWTEADQWDQRGAEHAAEIITWAIMDRNISIRWIETNTNGTTTETFKLHKLPNSSPDQLIAAYQHLTGNSPTDRIADDPRTQTTTTETASPEARRG